MIGHIKGTVLHKDFRSAIIEAGGIGYVVHTTIPALGRCAVGKESSFFTHLAVREDSLDLYGFGAKDELQFFEMLITVSGIGPKSALGILNVATISTLKQAISTGDTSHLTKVSGIGKKTAERVVLGLKDKFEGVEHDSAGSREDADTIEALKAIGYSQDAAREALKKIPEGVSGTSDKVKEALKILSNH